MDRTTQQIGAQAAIIGLAIFVLAGCAAPKETVRPSSVPDETLKKYEAEFRPSDHDPEPGGTPGRTGTGVDTESDTTTVETSSTTSLEMVPGFRVQLVSTTSIDEANAKKAEAEAMFPGESFYVEYDPPAYKLRAGNFQSRVEAERFARQVSSRGFQDAWTVPERVYRQPPPPEPTPGAEEK